MGKHVTICLSEAERKYLGNIIQSDPPQSAKWIRAQILLSSDKNNNQHLTVLEIADKYNTNHTTVETIRKKYLESGVERAVNTKMRETPPMIKITEQDEEYILKMIQNPPPNNRKKWNSRLIADQLIADGRFETISHVAIFKFLNKKGIIL